jgi:hypothetical protein
LSKRVKLKFNQKESLSLTFAIIHALLDTRVQASPGKTKNCHAQNGKEHKAATHHRMRVEENKRKRRKRRKKLNKKKKE